jgi:hypothetical protein
MTYSYKVVSLAKFIDENPGLKFGTAASNTTEMSHGISQVIESLINHYAADGWEYWSSEAFATDAFKTASSAIFETVMNSVLPGSVAGDGLWQVFVFRRGEHAAGTSHTSRYEASWTEARDLTDERYQIHLSKKFGIEKSELLGKFISDGNAYETLEGALSAAHEKDLLIEAEHEAEQKVKEEAKRLEDEQEKINNDTSKVSSDTHVNCMYCGTFVRNEATKCRECGRKLTPKIRLT